MWTHIFEWHLHLHALGLATQPPEGGVQLDEHVLTDHVLEYLHMLPVPQRRVEALPHVHLLLQTALLLGAVRIGHLLVRVDEDVIDAFHPVVAKSPVGGGIALRSSSFRLVISVSFVFVGSASSSSWSHSIGKSTRASAFFFFLHFFFLVLPTLSLRSLGAPVSESAFRAL